MWPETSPVPRNQPLPKTPPNFVFGGGCILGTAAYKDSDNTQDRGPPWPHSDTEGGVGPVFAERH